MCCEDCPKYERCEEIGQLKDDCCPECPEYYDCAGADTFGKDKDSYRHGEKNEEDYL